jgi:hypothetical protein
MSADTMPPEGGIDKGYPKREKFFAHRLVRILTKDAVANELGAEVCWLLTVVAMQEDSKRYRGAVTYYNGQLLPLCGFSSDKVLDRARAKAVKAGFLVYIPGGRRAAGKYWCTIPDTVKDVPDGPCDETAFETGMNGDSTAIETAVERPLNGGLGNHLGSVETAVLRRSTFGSKGDPSYLFPDPTPDPTPAPTPKKKEAIEAPLGDRWIEDANEWDARYAEFVRLWKSTKGVVAVHFHELPADMIRMFQAVWSESWWVEAKKALEKLRDGPPKSGTVIAMDTFLKSVTAGKINGGSYDWSRADRKRVGLGAISETKPKSRGSEAPIGGPQVDL